MQKIKYLLLLIVCFSLSSCAAIAENGLIGGKETCTYSNNGGTCKGYFEKVLGENSKSYKNVFVGNEEAVKVNMTVSSTDGAMTFALMQYGKEEDWQYFEVLPDTPATFVGWVIPDEDGNLTIQFNQNPKTSTGQVDYQFVFTR
jgi:hypothetical protein